MPTSPFPWDYTKVSVPVPWNDGQKPWETPKAAVVTDRPPPAYSWLIRNFSGDVLERWPLRSEWVTPALVAGVRCYYVQPPHYGSAFVVAVNDLEVRDADAR